MKRLIPILLLASLFVSGCEYRQLFTVSPAAISIKADSLYTFENDTIKIVYSFWKQKGVLGYAVFNKLSVPLYIDWKKSSFVVNDVKMNYWADETISTGTSIHSGYYSGGYYGLLGISGGSTISSGKSVKPERITFLAPHSEIIKSEFSLWSGNGILMGVGSKSSLLRKPGYGDVQVKYLDYSKSNSPLVFRNFLSYSMTENFSAEIYVDNEFYVSKIQQMKYSAFQGRFYYDKERKAQRMDEPFSSPTKFYINVKH